MSPLDDPKLQELMRQHNLEPLKLKYIASLTVGDVRSQIAALLLMLEKAKAPTILLNRIEEQAVEISELKKQLERAQYSLRQPRELGYVDKTDASSES